MAATMPRVVLAGDHGNAIDKQIVVNGKPKTHRITYPHAVIEVSQTDFENAEVRREPSSNDDLFWYVRKVGKEEIDAPFMVGQSAFRTSLVKPLSGSLKYRPNYYGPYAIRGLIGLLPHGHDNIHLVAMFPPLDVAYTESLKICLGGKHVVTFPNGRTLTYVVREVSVVDEPVGGLYHTLLDFNGKPIEETLYTKNRILVLDIGGRVTTLTPATKKGEIDHVASKGLEEGINDVQEIFVREMRHRYPEFADLRAMKPDQVREALYKGKWDGGGEILDVGKAKEAACTQFLNKVSQLYKDMGGPRSYNHILITGGGGGLLRRELNEQVLNHKSVILADQSFREMHLANVRGAAKMAVASGYVKAE